MELVWNAALSRLTLVISEKALTTAPINGTKLQLSRENQFDSFFKG